MPSKKHVGKIPAIRGIFHPMKKQHAFFGIAALLLLIAGASCAPSANGPTDTTSAALTGTFSAFPQQTGTQKVTTATLSHWPTNTITPTETALYTMEDWGEADGPWGGVIFDMVVHPLHPEIIYANTRDFGFFTSKDAGGTWRSANQGLQDPGFSSLTFDPSTPSIAYVLSTTGNAYKTTDGGENWSAIHFVQGNITALAVDPVNTGILYAGTNTGKVYQSADGGKRWDWMYPGLQNDVPISSLVIDPESTSTLYASTMESARYLSPDGDIYKSVDGGKNWIPVNTGLPEGTGFYGLIIHPKKPSILYVFVGGTGLFRSVNGGASWSGAKVALPKDDTVIAFTVDPSDTSILYAGTIFNGIYQSVNNGSTWRKINNGLLPKWIGGLAVDPKKPSTVYAGTMDGVYKTTDAGGEWRRSTTGVGACTILSLAVDPKTPATVYAATENGLWKSLNGGGSWKRMASDFPTAKIESLVIDPTDPNILYVSIDEWGDQWYRVMKSTNGGEDWKEIKRGREEEYYFHLAIAPTTPATLYGVGANLLEKTADGGATWQTITAGLPMEEPWWANSIAVDPTTPNTLYLGTGKFGLYKSTDGGGSWENIYTGQGIEFAHLMVDPATPTTLYCADFEKGVFASDDGGVSWSPYGKDRPPGKYTHGLISNPFPPTTLYVSTDEGVFQSTAGGPWISLGFTGGSVGTLAIDPSTASILYADTTDGVLSLRLSP